MSTKSNTNSKIVAVKTIDAFFYERCNAKRSHKHALEMVINPLFGICEETFRNYRDEPEELLNLQPLPEHLRAMLRLDIGLLVKMPPVEVAKFLNWFCDRVDEVTQLMKDDHAPFNALTLIRYLILALTPKEDSAKK